LKVKFIINPIAGRRRNIKKEMQKIKQIFSAKRAQADFHITNSPGEATEIAQRSKDQGYDIIVAVGGDGTMNEVATSLEGSDIPIGIIPQGSGNGLARALGIPLKLEKACETLFENRFISIDAGRINNKKFFNVAGIGFDAQIGWHYNQKYGKSRGFFSYVLSGFQVFFRFDREEITVMLNEENINITPLLLTVANSRQYGAGAIIAPTADPSDGLFDVCIVKDIGFFTGLFHVPKLFTGTIDKVPHLSIYKASSIDIVRKKPGPIQIDGEPHMGEAHLKISLLPKSLKVCVPDKKDSFQFDNKNER
jgi:diacylglycerol kinase (ATP)